MIKRRLSFAAPFVITALLAPGCGGSPQKPETPPQPDPDVDKWVNSGSHWTFKKANGDQIWHGVDGTCQLIQDMGPCPKGAMCNPPPPQDVECPPGLPPEATQPAPVPEAKPAG